MKSRLKLLSNRLKKSTGALYQCSLNSLNKSKRFLLRKNMEMKSALKHSLVLLVGIGIGLLVVGCSSTRIKRVSGAEFVNQAKASEHLVSSFHWSTYIGSTHQRAYLEFGEAPALGKFAGRTTVYWTPLSEFPKDLADQLKAGNPPWKPWHQSQTNTTERTTESTPTKWPARCADKEENS